MYAFPDVAADNMCGIDCKLTNFLAYDSLALPAYAQRYACRRFGLLTASFLLVAPRMISSRRSTLRQASTVTHHTRVCRTSGASRGLRWPGPTDHIALTFSVIALSGFNMNLFDWRPNSARFLNAARIVIGSASDEQSYERNAIKLLNPIFTNQSACSCHGGAVH